VRSGSQFVVMESCKQKEHDDGNVERAMDSDDEAWSLEAQQDYKLYSPWEPAGTWERVCQKSRKGLKLDLNMEYEMVVEYTVRN
jgi:hypothetical protein